MKELEQKVINLLADNERLANSNNVLKQALKEIVEFDSRSMFERCVDCGTYIECTKNKICKDSPNSGMGIIALKALGIN